MNDLSAIQPFIEQCLSRFKGISSIWLFGSRANNTFRKDSDWDLLIFANKQTLDLMRKAKELKRSDVDIQVVYDGNKSEEPWPDIKDGQPNPKRLVLTANPDETGREPVIDWRLISITEASYLGTKDKWGNKHRMLKAFRIWPAL